MQHKAAWGLLAILLLGLWGAAPGRAAQPGISYDVETFLPASEIITAIAFAPDGRLFYTEKNTGRVRVVSAAGELQAEPVLQVARDTVGERGMIGIAIDPNFASNGYLWVYHTDPNYGAGGQVVQRLLRFREQDGIGGEPQVMLEIPIVENQAMHVAGNLHFDAEGYLYLAIGDNGDPTNAQNLDSYPGKLHRFQVEGDELLPAPDNPWEGNSAFAIGLRNPIDFSFDPYSGAIFGTENGAQCDDEVNLLQAGANYGWRPDYGVLANCDDNLPNPDPAYTPPLVFYTPTIAPVGITVYSGEQLPDYVGDIFFCAWKDGNMRRLVLNETRSQVIYQEVMELRRSRCHTDLATGPDGALYYVSSSGIHRLVEPQSR